MGSDFLPIQSRPGVTRRGGQSRGADAGPPSVNEVTNAVRLSAAGGQAGLVTTLQILSRPLQSRPAFAPSPGTLGEGRGELSPASRPAGPAMADG
jgi:hypothetical protein